MNEQELKEWWALRLQLVNGYHMGKNDIDQLARLNHLVMEASHDIHNKNMLNDL